MPIRTLPPCFTHLLILGTLLPLSSALSRQTHAQSPRLDNRPPNIVFILTDDLGYHDLGVTGSTFYETPHIDRIALEGIQFVNGYATCQVCSPSRASIQTGKYPARLKITDWIGAAAGTGWKRNTRLLPPQYQRQLPADEVTLAEAFAAAGYKTFFAGKWHLGDQGSFPEDHGFEINIGGHHRGSPPGGFFSPYDNPKLKDGPAGEYLPLRLGQETADFIAANRDQPFLAFLSFYAVHAPLETTRPRWEKYRQKALAQATPAHRFLFDRTLPVRQVQDHPVYAGLLEATDEAVGLVLDRLDELGLTDNTIVVFTSDNGGVSAGDAKATSNLPLRGGKGRQWEGGIREPFFIRFPGVVQPGSKSDVPAIGTDFFPTLLELCQLPLCPEQHVDGVSLAPVLRGETLPARSLFWHYPHYGNQGGEPSSIILQEPWKLIHYYEDGRRELYDLATDPGEQHDVAPDHAERVAQMGAELDRWLQEVQADFPTPNPNFDAAAYARQLENTRTRGILNLERQHARFLDADYQPNPTWWGSQPPQNENLPAPIGGK